MIKHGDLKTAIEHQHVGVATFVRGEPVTETWNGKTVWNGVVQVFELTGNERTRTAYARSAAIDGSPNRRVYAVLGVQPVNTARDAVRAAIVADSRQKN